MGIRSSTQCLDLPVEVWVSSETTLGLRFAEINEMTPRYPPVGEERYPVPMSTYALSNVASEIVAGQIAHWSEMAFVALRLSNIMDPDDYRTLPSVSADTHARKWNIWGSVLV